MVSQESYTQARDVLNKAQRVLVCVNNRSSLDTHLAAAALVMYLNSVGKNATVCVNGEMILRHKELYAELGIEPSEDVKPMSYVITVDHSEGGIEKVSYDDVEGKFRLYLTPSADAKSFNFDKVTFSEGGGGVDAIWVFGARSLRWMDSIVEQNKELFDAVPIVNVNNIAGEQEYGSVRLVDVDLSVCELLYPILKGERALSDRVSQVLLMGILDRVQLLQVNSYSIASVEMILDLVRSGGDMKSAMRKLYFDKSLGNFELLRRVMSNAKYDLNTGLIWSSVSAYDLTQAGISRSDFILDGRIVCNICREFKAAFVLYEVAEGEIIVEFESNRSDLDAKQILSEYKVSGNESRVFFTVRSRTVPDVEQELIGIVTPRLQGVLDASPFESHVVEEKRGADVGVEDKKVEVSKSTEGKSAWSSVKKTAVKAKKVSTASEEESGMGLVAPPPISPEDA